ncbi:hypothetical protein R3P38DRAFT_2666399 [Favolaschia claudopus]|uniref:F-box domain-containing protein n=1 Tax=Favolaschia claudopus TaxID=2862362 RepID=A0AAV9ZCM4_9AGAR
MLSPFAQRLGTNYCPTDVEVLEIQNLISQALHQLLSLDSAVEKHEEDRKTLSSYIDEHKTLLSPVRRLPLEILSEIFMACLPTDRFCAMSASEAPVLLGHICSSWRALSLAIPQLWASLHVVEPLRYETAAEKVVGQRLDGMKTWLGRSGQCPLSISLHCSSGNHNLTTDDEWAGIVAPPLPPDLFSKELIPFAGRWKHLDLVMYPEGFMALANLTAADVPMLQSISLFLHTSYFGIDDLDSAQSGILEGPSLSGFATWVSGLNRSLPLQWHLLVDLTIEADPWEPGLHDEQALETLSCCPQLQTCKLSLYLSPGTQLRLCPVELRHLHSLELFVDDASESCPSSFLYQLRVPNLRKLVFRGGTLGGSLPPFLSSCKCLDSFDIEGTYIPKFTLRKILRALSPTLRHLTIRDVRGGPVAGVSGSLDNDLLALFTPSDNTQWCCPSLQTLTVTCPHQASDLAIQQFVERRMAMGGSNATPSLKRICFHFYRPMELDLKIGLKPFIGAGLEVDTMYILPQPVSPPESPVLPSMEPVESSIWGLVDTAPSDWS